MAILPREYAIYKCNEPQYRSVGENILLQLELQLENHIHGATQIDMQTQRPQDVISDRSPCGPVCMRLALKNNINIQNG
jgi:hypothetical protein